MIRKASNYMRMSLAAAMLAMLPCFFAVADVTTVSKEYQVKAAYLYNILKFVQWSVPTVNVCVYGTNPFGDFLQALEQRTVDGRNIKTRVIIGNGVEGCQVVFISSKNGATTAKVITAANNQQILTIGEQDDFNALGGIVRFVEVNNTIRFDLNMTKAKAVGLKINSQLVETAREVQ